MLGLEERRINVVALRTTEESREVQPRRNRYRPRCTITLAASAVRPPLSSSNEVVVGVESSKCHWP